MRNNQSWQDSVLQCSADFNPKSSMELLLVEDDEKTNRVMILLLRRLGIKVQTARKLLPALEALSRLPDVVVLDLPLLSGGGDQVLKMIRDTGLRCRVAVIMSETEREMASEIAPLRPDAIFPKPLNFEAFGEWLCDLFP
jgi:DNA-binding response OmpR family regulator